MAQGDVGKIYKALASQQQGHGFKLQVHHAPPEWCHRCRASFMTREAMQKRVNFCPGSLVYAALLPKSWFVCGRQGVKAHVKLDQAPSSELREVHLARLMAA